jgi:hypothetical protein
MDQSLVEFEVSPISKYLCLGSLPAFCQIKEWMAVIQSALTHQYSAKRVNDQLSTISPQTGMTRYPPTFSTSI